MGFRVRVVERTMTREDVEGMLYDQHILFEMRLRTVKLEIMQHVTGEFAKLRDFISTLVPPSSGTSTSAAAPVVNEPNLLDDLTKVQLWRRLHRITYDVIADDVNGVYEITSIPYGDMVK
ncbi:Hypothetical predicted protein [Olea europaea subsp. europaea]|uniref:Uncharacterized protein n=1 Tax=Olea europaea subsp. europaea TaxID=158383 RepID=A0A8S0UKU7_OLEEU|nr:Hypothetical predicted protein [Olea europaea subsp. europaea]